MASDIKALGCRVEAHPEEEVHALVQRALEAAEGLEDQRAVGGPQGRRAAGGAARDALSEEAGPLQQIDIDNQSFRWYLLVYKTH